MITKPSFCSVGLLSFAETGTLSSEDTEAQKILADIIRDQYPDRVSLYANDRSTVITFNDHSDTTFEDVERCFEKAEVAWDERI